MRWRHRGYVGAVTTTPLRELLAAVPSLNQPDQPFTFEVDGDKIVGRWDIVKATSLYPTEVTHLDKKYKIVVDLDEDEGTFDFDEKESKSSAKLDGGGLSFGKEGFSGKSSSKEFSFEFGGLNKTDEGVSLNPVVYSFETSRIKEPLFTFLESHGWKREKGLLSRLFNR
jgi:hypothetical protein